MLGFSPFKRHANKFNYKPRYFDPEKEAREERRAELLGYRSKSEDGEYRPGQYINTQREARAGRRTAKVAAGQKRVWMTMGVAVLMLLFIYILYPRLADVFLRAQQTPTRTIEQPVDGFDPYAPITIVPNDYQE